MRFLIFSPLLCFAFAASGQGTPGSPPENINFLLRYDLEELSYYRAPGDIPISSISQIDIVKMQPHVVKKQIQRTIDDQTITVPS